MARLLQERLGARCGLAGRALELLSIAGVLFVGAMAAVFVLGAGFRIHSGNPRNVPGISGNSGSVRAHVGCRPFQAANQRLCRDGVVYTIQGGQWAYTGAPTPVPGVPRR